MEIFQSRGTYAKDIESLEDAQTEINMLKTQIATLHNRMNDAETDLVKVSDFHLLHLTPSSDLEDVKRTLNYIVNYLNERKGRDARIHIN